MITNDQVIYTIVYVQPTSNWLSGYTTSIHAGFDTGNPEASYENVSVTADGNAIRLHTGSFSGICSSGTCDFEGIAMDGYGPDASANVTISIAQ